MRQESLIKHWIWFPDIYDDISTASMKDRWHGCWLLGYWSGSWPVDSPCPAADSLVVMCRWSTASPCSLWSDTPGCWSAPWLYHRWWGWSSCPRRWWCGRLSWSTWSAVCLSGHLSWRRWRPLQGTSLADIHHRYPASLSQQVSHLSLVSVCLELTGVSGVYQ